MGNFKSKNRIHPINLINLEKETQNLLNICKKLEDNIKILKEEEERKNNFECCVCYDNKIINKKKIRCKHQICKRCFNLITDKRCPLCRKKMTIYLVGYNR